MQCLVNMRAQNRIITKYFVRQCLDMIFLCILLGFLFIYINGWHLLKLSNQVLKFSLNLSDAYFDIKLKQKQEIQKILFLTEPSPQPTFRNFIMFQTVQDGSRRFQKVQEDCSRFKNIQEGLKSSQDPNALFWKLLTLCSRGVFCLLMSQSILP